MSPSIEDCTMTDVVSPHDDPMEVDKNNQMDAECNASEVSSEEDLSDVLDLTKLFGMLDDIKSSGKKIAGRKVLLLIGDTGAGKTTTTLYLAGVKFKEDDDEDDHFEAQDLPSHLAHFKYSSAAVSCTKTIHATEITLPNGEVITICDTPGFGDTKGTEMEISNGLGITHALIQAGIIKPVVVINYPALISGRCRDLKKTLGIVVKMMGHRTDFLQFQYIFNGCPQDKRAKVHKRLEKFRKEAENNPGEVLGEDAVHWELLNTMLLDMVEKTKKGCISIDPEDSEKAPTMLEELCQGEWLEDPANAFVNFVSQGASDKLTLQVNRMLRRMNKAFTSGDMESAMSELRGLVGFAAKLSLPQLEQAVNQGQNQGRRLLGKLRDGVSTAVNLLVENQEAGEKYDQLVVDLKRQLALHFEADATGLANLCAVPVEEKFENTSTLSVDKLLAGLQEEIGKTEDGDMIEKQLVLQSVLLRLQSLAGTLKDLLAAHKLDTLSESIVKKVDALMNFEFSTAEEQLQDQTTDALKESHAGLHFLLRMNHFFIDSLTHTAIKDNWMWLDARLQIVLDGLVAQSRTSVEKLIQHTDSLEAEKDYSQSLSCPALVSVNAEETLVESRAFLALLASPDYELVLEDMQKNTQNGEDHQDPGMVVAHFDTSLCSAVSDFADFAQNWTKALFDDDKEAASKKDKAESLLKSADLLCQVCVRHQDSGAEAMKTIEKNLVATQAKLKLFVDKCESGPVVIPKKSAALLHGPKVLGENWHQMLVLLRAYKKKHGHCNVPQSHPQLGLWVKSQRQETIKYQDDFKKTWMTKERLEALAALGFQFVVINRVELWEKRFQELKQFQEEHGHCNVPRKEPTKVLGKWVDNQRVSYKKKDTRLTRDRIAKLNSVGFKWAARG